MNLAMHDRALGLPEAFVVSSTLIGEKREQIKNKIELPDYFCSKKRPRARRAQADRTSRRVIPPAKAALTSVEISLGVAHTGQMAEDHQITVVVEPDLLRSGRYRWTLLRSGQAQDRSEMSFATKREADADAEKALKRRIAAWKAT